MTYSQEMEQVYSYNPGTCTGQNTVQMLLRKTDAIHAEAINMTDRLSIYFNTKPYSQISFLLLCSFNLCNMPGEYIHSVSIFTVENSRVKHNNDQLRDNLTRLDIVASVKKNSPPSKSSFRYIRPLSIKAVHVNL